MMAAKVAFAPWTGMLFKGHDNNCGPNDTVARVTIASCSSWNHGWPWGFFSLASALIIKHGSRRGLIENGSSADPALYDERRSPFSYQKKKKKKKSAGERQWSDGVRWLENRYNHLTWCADLSIATYWSCRCANSGFARNSSSRSVCIGIFLQSQCEDHLVRLSTAIPATLLWHGHRRSSW